MPNQEQNFSSRQLELISAGESDFQYQPHQGDYVRLTLMGENGLPTGEVYYSNLKIPGDSDNYQIVVYPLPDGTITVKPNEILQTNYSVEGNYKLKFDFLRNMFSYFYTESASDDDADGYNDRIPFWSDPAFVIKEISPSRKEIRLIARNQGSLRIDLNENVVPEQDFSYRFFNAIGTLDSNDSYPDYTFDWVVTIRDGENIPITNTTFDHISDPEYSSIIVRLGKALPTDVVLLTEVGIEKELALTQTQDIIYKSNVSINVVGGGLEPHWDGWSEDNGFSADQEQNYNDLFGSASYTEEDQQIITTTKEDINLNIDFNEFENHTFFGSATSKLSNFKEKVGQIQGHLTELSKSLVTTTGSFTFDYRKDLFNKINSIKNTFTPYEKFLYYDSQQTSTASAPSLGANYTYDIPVQQHVAGTNINQGITLNNHEGFQTVYKHTSTGSISDRVDLFTDKYDVSRPPFYHYTGSFYLSFLLKGDEHLSYDGAKANSGSLNLFDADNHLHSRRIPVDAYTSSIIENPAITGSEWRRYIFKAQQYGWQPTGSATGSGNLGYGSVQKILDESNFAELSTNLFSNYGSHYWKILSSSQQIASASDKSSDGLESFPISLPADYNNLGTYYTASNIPFTGSILPSGDLFKIHWESTASDESTSSLLTDIKLTVKNPTNTLPFSSMYDTSSIEFSDWYNDLYVSASTYDENNIHSLYNNLPDNFLINSDYSDLHTFVNLWGENFDDVRVYIDSFKTLYSRGYGKTDSVPDNLLPIISQNLGWELINPFSSSLSNYFSSLTGSNETINEITNKTWRKTLNNLIYIYKSKGTHNSMRALLNVYGYPPDLITLTEGGGSISEHNPIVLDDTYDAMPGGLDSLSGDISYVKENFVYDMMHFNGSNPIEIDWNQNSAKSTYAVDSLGQNTSKTSIQFNMIPEETVESMSILEATGSGAYNRKNWDLCYVPSASSQNRGFLKLRMQVSQSANLGLLHSSSYYYHNDLTASTDYFDIGNDRMFNVVFSQYQSLVPKITVSSKFEDKIQLLLTASYGAPEILESTFSISQFQDAMKLIATGSTLVVGSTFKGDIADIKLWNNEPSASKIKQSTFNPSVAVGNNFSNKTDLIYHYRLNELHKTGSKNTKLINDANPDYKKDFSFTYPHDIHNNLYHRRLIDRIKFVPRTDGHSQKNSNQVIIDPERKVISELNPDKRSELSNYNLLSPDQRKTSKTVDLSQSPSDKYDSYITDSLPDKDIAQYFAKWEDLYEPKYNDLDNLRKDILAGVSIDINEYIRAQAGLFNPHLLHALNSLLPARSKIDYGVTIKPNILERNKYDYKNASIAEADLYFGFISDMHDFTGTKYIEPTKNDTLNITDAVDILLSYITKSEGNLPADDFYNLNSEYINSIIGDTISMIPGVSGSYQYDLTSSLPKIYELALKDLHNLSGSIVNTYDFTLDSLLPDLISFMDTKVLSINKSILEDTLGLTKLFQLSSIVKDILKVDEWNIVSDYVNLSINNQNILTGNSINLVDVLLQSWLFEGVQKSLSRLATTTMSIDDYMSMSSLYINMKSGILNKDENLKTKHFDWNTLFLSIHNVDLIDTINTYYSLSAVFKGSTSGTDKIPVNDTKIDLVNDYLLFQQIIIPTYETTLNPETNLRGFYNDYNLVMSTQNLHFQNSEALNLYDLHSISMIYGLTAPYIELNPGTTGDNPNTSLNIIYINQHEKTITEIEELWTRGYKDKLSPVTTWGSDVDSTWIMNDAWPGVNSDYNTGYADNHYLRYYIGDYEYVSQSSHWVTCSNYIGQSTIHTTAFQKKIVMHQIILVTMVEKCGIEIY